MQVKSVVEHVNNGWSLSSKRHDVSEQKIRNLEVGFNKYAKVTNDRFEELKKVATSTSDDLQKFKDKTI